jgi:hypothetical protein
MKSQKYIDTENKIKPLPLGRGQLPCNFLFSVPQTPNKPCTKVHGKYRDFVIYKFFTSMAADLSAF